MTTLCIEEILEKTLSNPDIVDYAGDYSGRAYISEYHLRTALTQAHQAGIEEAVKIMESMKEDGETPFGHQELHETELAYNQALDDTIKALQNKK